MQRGSAVCTNRNPRETIMAQTARNEAEKATDNVAEFGKRTADNAVKVARDTAEGATEIGQMYADLAKEQTQQGVETFQALTRMVDWNEVAQIQGEFLRTSLERATAFTRRYFEVVQAVMTSAASATKHQAPKAA
jgi:hypothetical protein